MKIGYARVSTQVQNLSLQKDALKKAGCAKIFVDKVSGTVAKRIGLEKAQDQLRKGDTLIVWRLDRLGRSLRNLIEWITDLESRGVGFKSTTESINTTSPSGKLVFHVFAALAEFERNLISERTQAGLVAARVRGRLGGRPSKLDKAQKKLLAKLYYDNETPVLELCKMFKISKPTLYKYVRY